MYTPFEEADFGEDNRAKKGLTESKKLVAKLVTVATVEPEDWRALRKVESITAFTRNMPANDAACTARPT